MKDRVNYTATGVNYDKIDPFKVMAQKASSETSVFMEDFGFKVIEASRGESAFAWEEPDSYRTQVIEGLGTKNLIADAVRANASKSYYDFIAQDTIATFINDVITSGATPYLISMYVAAGDSEWFDDKERATDLLINGWMRVCKENKITWGGGESPSLRGIINPGVCDLAGVANGIIKPKEKGIILGDRLEVGDAIVIAASSGIHANGLSLARSVAQFQKQGYLTSLPSGLSFGEALLKPTHIYSGIQKDVLDQGVDVHYMVNVTGHGWRKIMRANYDFSYVINNIPPVPEELLFIKEQIGADDAQMYGTFNMGAGFVFMVPQKEAQGVVGIINSHGLNAWNSGSVVSGKREVIIEPNNVIYSQETLSIR